MPDPQSLPTSPPPSEWSASPAVFSTTPTSASMCLLGGGPPRPPPVPLPVAQLQAVAATPSSPSRLSTSRPSSTSPPSTPASPHFDAPLSPKPMPPPRIPLLRTPASTRPPTPAQVRPPPVLLNILSAADGESILVIVVEDPSEAGEHSTPSFERGRVHGGRVYGGSQGGDIHVRSLELVWDFRSSVSSRSPRFRSGTCRRWHYELA